MRHIGLVSFVLLAATQAGAAVLTVGPGQQFATIAAAVAASQDGDTLQVQAGTYTNDFAEISTRITLVAVGGRVEMIARELLPNEKGILITDTDVSITGFTFVGARIPGDQGENGAGIRYQGGNLTLSECWFHDNQDGLLADADAQGSISIDRSEFSANGDRVGPGTGYTHNIYVGAVASLSITNSYFHNANVGHEIKSRALQTTIANTRVTDGSATASYSIDLPNGGIVSITGAQIEQGPNSQNPVIISYGEEGNVPANSSLSVQNSLIENDLTSHAPLSLNNASSITATLGGLQTYGIASGQLVSGPANVGDVTPLATEPAIPTTHPWAGK